MKKITVLSSLLVALIVFASATFETSSSNESTEIKFHEGNWKSALLQAKKENKLIFLDANTSWCGPCKKMEKYTFTNPDVAKYYNKHFINVKMNMEKGEGRNIARKLNVRYYPSLFFINAKGEVALKNVGYMNGPEFLALGKKAKALK